jgi:hypothetical protein
VTRVIVQHTCIPQTLQCTSGYSALQDYERVLHEENDDFFADVAEILKPMDVFRDWDSDQVCATYA